MEEEVKTSRYKINHGDDKYRMGSIVNIIAFCMVTGGNYTYHGEHVTMHITVES